ncbi:MAG: hypothetical protein ACLFP4_10975 [Spirochaetales bacterium]
MRPHPSTSVLYRVLRIVSSAHVFFVLAILLVSAVFVLGNYQEFLLDSQLLLLQLMSAAGILGVGSGLWYVSTLIIWMIRRRHPMLLRLLLGLFSTTLSLAIVVLASTLQVVAGDI